MEQVMEKYMSYSSRVARETPAAWPGKRDFMRGTALGRLYEKNCVGRKQHTAGSQQTPVNLVKNNENKKINIKIIM
ncbi:MAG: hypothetical protein PHW56_10615 [Methanosarcinaceae archaeon]|nr:hypothetical protein [Methanosarcinaceae archaeon]